MGNQEINKEPEQPLWFNFRHLREKVVHTSQLQGILEEHTDT
jgi:hypothetical protein